MRHFPCETPLPLDQFPIRASSLVQQMYLLGDCWIDTAIGKLSTASHLGIGWVGWYCASIKRDFDATLYWISFLLILWILTWPSSCCQTKSMLFNNSKVKNSFTHRRQLESFNPSEAAYTTMEKTMPVIGVTHLIYWRPYRVSRCSRSASLESCKFIQPQCSG